MKIAVTALPVELRNEATIWPFPGKSLGMAPQPNLHGAASRRCRMGHPAQCSVRWRTEQGPGHSHIMNRLTGMGDHVTRRCLGAGIYGESTMRRCKWVWTRPRIEKVSIGSLSMQWKGLLVWLLIRYRLKSKRTLLNLEVKADCDAGKPGPEGFQKKNGNALPFYSHLQISPKPATGSFRVSQPTGDRPESVDSGNHAMAFLAA